MGPRRYHTNFEEVRSETRSMSSLCEDQEPSLLDLPTEILQIIVSYTLLETPVQLNGRCRKALLTPTGRAVTQTCHLLRELAIDFLSKNVLWVHIICHTAEAYPRIEWLFKPLRSTPDPFRENLPQHLAGLHLEFGNLQTKTTEEHAYVLRPFNFRWIARLVGCLLGAADDVQCLNIWHDPLQSHNLQQIIREQIHSLVPLLCYDIEVSVNDSNLQQTVHPHYDDDDADGFITCAFPRVDDLLDVLIDLDGYGLALQANLLCMHYYYHRFIIDRHRTIAAPFAEDYSAIGMGSLKEWARDDGTLERAPDNHDHLERVRRARTLNYLETRAVKGFLEDVEKYNWDYVSDNYEWISEFKRPELGNIGWDDPRFEDIFGLLDYELAQQHYNMAALHRIRADFMLHRMSRTRLLWDKRKYLQDLTSAFKYAFYGWSLDIDSEVHMTLLNDLLVTMPPRHLSTVLRDLLNEVKSDCEPKKYHFGGDYALFHAWARAGADMEGRCYHRMAQKLARQADVTFDYRRGDELPRCYDPEKDWVRRISFLHVRELDPSELFADDRARALAAMTLDDEDD